MFYSNYGRYLGQRLKQCGQVRALKERARALAVATRQPQPPPLLEHGKVGAHSGSVYSAGRCSVVFLTFKCKIPCWISKCMYSVRGLVILVCPSWWLIEGWWHA